MKPRFYFYLFFLLLGADFAGQAQDSPSFRTAVDRSAILIGEPVRLGADVVFPAGSAVELPVLDSVPHFEIIGKPTLDSLGEGANMHYRMEWKLASFDSGVFAIPALAVRMNNREYRSDSLAVTVSFGKTDSSVQYHDIKGIIDVANPAVRYVPWVVLGITVLALAGFVVLGARQGRDEVLLRVKAPPRQVSRTAYDEAMAALEALKLTALPDAAAVKKYYSDIDDVFRVFVHKSRGLPAMEATSEEIIGQVDRMDLEKTAFTRFASVLRLADFVKFAKYVPESPEHVRSLGIIRDSIRLINEIRK